MFRCLNVLKCFLANQRQTNKATTKQQNNGKALMWYKVHKKNDKLAKP